VVPSGASSAAAAVASAGNSAASQAAVSAFAEEVPQGLAPTLTGDFGIPATSEPGRTVVMPDAACSSSLGYGWLSSPGKLQIQYSIGTWHPKSRFRD